MGLFENRKNSGMVLAGVVLSSSVVSAASQGVVSAVPQSDALNSFAGEGVKNLDVTVLKFLKNNWELICLAVELIIIVGLIGYGIFFKKKNVEDVVDENDFKEKKEEVKEKNEEKNEEKVNILMNNKMVNKDDVEKQGEIDYIVKINAKENKGKNLEELKKLKGAGSGDLDIFLESIEGISEGCYLFLDKDKNIFYIDEEGDKISIKNNEGKNLKDVEGELISFMIEKGEYREGVVAVSVIGKIGLEKWRKFGTPDAVSIAENYKEVENHIVFVKKADEGNFEVSYVDEENFLCNFEAKKEEVISLFGEEKIKDKKVDYGEGINLGENDFNLLND